MGKFEYVQLESHGPIIRDDGIAEVAVAGRTGSLTETGLKSRVGRLEK